MEYKFRNSIPTHLRGLANHLAHSIMDPMLQKSSIVANGESVLGSLLSLGQQCPTSLGLTIPSLQMGRTSFQQQSSSARATGRK